MAQVVVALALLTWAWTRFQLSMARCSFDYCRLQIDHTARCRRVLNGVDHAQLGCALEDVFGDALYAARAVADWALGWATRSFFNLALLALLTAVVCYFVRPWWPSARTPEPMVYYPRPWRPTRRQSYPALTNH